MQPRFVPALCAAALLALRAPTWASDPIEQKLIALNATLQTATQNHDVATLAHLITDDYELVSSSGKVYDRAAFLADAGDTSFTYLLNQPENVAVRRHGDCAIVTAVLHVRYRASGKIKDVRIRYGDVWIETHGTWRYAFGEASPLKHP